jgi:hypothetical protein
VGEPMKFAMKVTAVGEVRDADGNLVETVPVGVEKILTAEELEQILKEKS